jgi:hypothetical protein
MGKIKATTDEENKEMWKHIPFSDGCYMCSNLGNIKSIPRNGTIKSERIMKKKLTHFGYNTVKLRIYGKAKNWFIHKLVAITFLENKENKPEVNHINGIKTDNNIVNLEWVTRSENMIHSYYVLNNKEGIVKATKKALDLNTIFNSVKIEEVIRMRKEGFSAIEIAKNFNSNRGTITKILKKNKFKFNDFEINNFKRKSYISEKRKKEIKINLIAKRGKKITSINLSTGEKSNFLSKREMARVLGLDRKSINSVLKGDCSQHKGYIFSYEN